MCVRQETEGKEEAMRLLLVCMHSFNQFISTNSWKFTVSETVAPAKAGIKRRLPFLCTCVNQLTFKVERILFWRVDIGS